MDYKKIKIRITPFEEWLRDVITAQLGEVGYDSFMETESGLEAYIPVPEYNKDNVNKVLNAFQNDFSFNITSEEIKDQNWNEVWEKNYFKPLLIKDECLVRAPFHTDFPGAKFEIIIEPNMAFGTGNHETTSLVIESILDTDMSGKSVLDMGCGTGILGILASMKGAKNVTAIDIDERSYSGTMENARINLIKNIDVKLGDAGLLREKKFDVIFANIHKNVLLNDMETYFNCLNQGGKLIMSGFYTEDSNDINSKAESIGLVVAETKTRNNWVAQAFNKD